MHLVRYIKLKINFLQAVHFTVVAWQHVMHTTIVQCSHFHSCGP
jgi:predicted  nucleic acid-binding Zn ribbon protein